MGKKVMDNVGLFWEICFNFYNSIVNLMGVPFML